MTREGRPSLVASQLFELAAHGNRDGAIRLVRSLLLSAADPGALIEDGLAPLQRRVGELWERSLIDIADAHAITEIVEELLSAIAFHVPRGTSRHRVIFACPHGEWHTLPARMASELLQMHNWSVTFAGASIPSATLAALARSSRPFAAVLSCTMASRLVAARDAIEAMHLLHVPVLVGGAGFGPDDRRARALGADGWARSVNEADRTLASWSRRPPTVNPASSAPPRLLSSADAADAVDAVLRRLGAGVSEERDAALTGVTGPDVSSMLDFVNAGLLTANPSLVADMLEWYRRTLAARHLPPGTLDLVLEALNEALPPIARTLLSQAVAATPSERPSAQGAVC